MKKVSFAFTIGVILSFILSVSCVMAAEKIGFVNYMVIARTSDAGKKFYEGMRKEAERADAKAKAKQNELIKLRDEINAQRSIMKPEKLREKQSHLEKQARDYELMLKDFNDELGKKNQEFLAKIEPTAISIIRQIGEKEKFTMVVDPNVMMIPYYDRTHDITKQVLAEFNRTYKEK